MAIPPDSLSLCDPARTPKAITAALPRRMWPSRSTFSFARCIRTGVRSLPKEDGPAGGLGGCRGGCAGGRDGAGGTPAPHAQVVGVYARYFDDQQSGASIGNQFRLGCESEACARCIASRTACTPVANLSHNASFHSFERITPSNRGIKHLLSPTC